MVKVTKKISLIHILPFILLIIISACANSEGPPDAQDLKIEKISGRDKQGIPIYRAKAPISWTRKKPLPEDSLEDTTKSLCEFFIQEEAGIIRITIHNFPSIKIEDRVPPASQIARWKRQFANLEPTSVSVTQQAWGGFAGLLFEGAGRINDKSEAVMGWSMQLGSEHYRNLLGASSQIRADYTIKATGPKELMKKYRKEIVAFARSFELIQEIPSRS